MVYEQAVNVFYIFIHSFIKHFPKFYCVPLCASDWEGKKHTPFKELRLKNNKNK